VLGRKYGCTADDGCGEMSSSKNAWKRHKSTHTQIASWRCDALVCQDGHRCDKDFYCKQDFIHHCKESHDITERKAKDYYMHQSGPFFCKFCNQIEKPPTEVRGLEAMDYQFNHILEHGQPIVFWRARGRHYLLPLISGHHLCVALVVMLVIFAVLVSR